MTQGSEVGYLSFDSIMVILVHMKGDGSMVKVMIVIKWSWQYSAIE